MLTVKRVTLNSWNRTTVWFQWGENIRMLWSEYATCDAVVGMIPAWSFQRIRDGDVLLIRPYPFQFGHQWSQLPITQVHLKVTALVPSWRHNKHTLPTLMGDHWMYICIWCGISLFHTDSVRQMWSILWGTWDLCQITAVIIYLKQLRLSFPWQASSCDCVYNDFFLRITNGRRVWLASHFNSQHFF